MGVIWSYLIFIGVRMEASRASDVERIVIGSVAKVGVASFAICTTVRPDKNIDWWFPPQNCIFS
jgi:hypothetical protein